VFARLLVRLLRASRGRLAVALAALISGAAVISALINVDWDVGRKLSQEFRSFGADLVVSAPLSRAGNDTFASGALRSAGEPALIDESVLLQIERARLPQVTAYAPFLYIVARARSEKQTVPIVVAGTWLDQVHRLAPTWKIEGSDTISRDDQARCFAGRTAADRLGLSPGSQVEVVYGGRRVSATVAGIMSAGAEEDNQIFLNLPVVQRLAGLPGKIELVQLEVAGSAAEIQSSAGSLRSALPGFEVRPIRQIAEAEGRLLSRIQLLVLLMVLLILVLTTLCVLATMAALAMERREDVGLMKALGGSISRVVALFMAEAGVLGAVGGVLGYAAGIGLSLWIGRRVFSATVSPRWEVLPITLFLTVGVALAGAFPLRLLGNVKPATILRGE
jgi:putative ABC transport system permease protein